MFDHEPDEEMLVPISQQHLALQELEQNFLLFSSDAET